MGTGEHTANVWIGTFRKPSRRPLHPAYLLRDEGAAYADALAASGVDVRHLACRGQIHTSVPMVDVIVSANGAREEIGVALQRFLGSSRDDRERAVAGAPLAPGA